MDPTPWTIPTCVRPHATTPSTLSNTVPPPTASRVVARRSEANSSQSKRSTRHLWRPRWLPSRLTAVLPPAMGRSPSFSPASRSPSLSPSTCRPWPGRSPRGTPMLVQLIPSPWLSRQAPSITAAGLFLPPPLQSSWTSGAPWSVLREAPRPLESLARPTIPCSSTPRRHPMRP